MLYLLDANVLITAHNLYYPVDAVEEFWDWLAHESKRGILKMPLETYEEVKNGGTNQDRDLLYGWVRDATHKSSLVLDEEVDLGLVQRVLGRGYAPDLTDDEIETIGRDPFLIAYALADPENRCVVTTEASARRKVRQNRRIPDVCADLGVNCCDTFTMLRALRFTTRWRGRSPVSETIGGV
jgi:hypothetical protein